MHIYRFCLQKKSYWNITISGYLYSWFKPIRPVVSLGNGLKWRSGNQQRQPSPNCSGTAEDPLGALSDVSQVNTEVLD